MIESISIANIATFGATPEHLDDLPQINYIFGSNGTGKTTISRVIADESFSATCRCRWRDGDPLETVVLNQDFIDRNFAQLRGVFTLGEGHADAQNRIDAVNEDLEKENNALAALKRTLSGDADQNGKQGELSDLESDLQRRCWAQKQKYDAAFHGAFTGYRNNARNFKDKVLEEVASNKAPSKDVNELQERAATMFGSDPSTATPAPTFDTARVVALECDPILAKKVVGKTDVDIAAMIAKLGNSDWVRQGIAYYRANDRTCPFCQEPTAEAFAASLEEYFDESFEADSRAIEAVELEYESETTSIIRHINNLIESYGQFLDIKAMESDKEALEQQVEVNRQRLTQKKQEPSRSITLKSSRPILASIKRLIRNARVKTRVHNHTVDHLVSERAALTSEIWRFIIGELEDELKDYHTKKVRVSKAIDGISARMKESSARIKSYRTQIRELEQQATSIRPTIDAINRTLGGFGFHSFKLAIAEDGKHYELVRCNGDDARQTLSEGEKTFVVFLYFYHLLQGSIEESGVTHNRVVVFDDPVSSLDSDVLFIVSSLIKNICDKAASGASNIKQVFVMTHNVYFHKEVTYRSKRASDKAMKDESFWIVRQRDQRSTLERYEMNPIKTSYELLWMEVRTAADTGTPNENTLRRILEHYFTILGSVDRDDICSHFGGEEQIICKSLFAWVNAGSHSALDDAHITPSETMAAKYIDVFRRIFDVTGHEGHYKMMMGETAVTMGPAVEDE